MSSRESFALPPDCALRRSFPDGTVHVEMVGLESHEGPSHIDLYAQSWEEVPRVPQLHLKVEDGSGAAWAVETALREAHESGEPCLSDGDYGCIALDSLRLAARNHRQESIAV